MCPRAAGTFEVSLCRWSCTTKKTTCSVARLSTRHFRGDLNGTGTVEVRTAGTKVKGSARYVAIEKVMGAPNGRHGTFFLQHSGIVNREAQQLRVTVVPDSGTGDLTGVSEKWTSLSKRTSIRISSSTPFTEKP